MKISAALKTSEYGNFILKKIIYYKSFKLKLDSSKNVAFLLSRIQNLAPYVEGYLLLFKCLKRIPINELWSETEFFTKLKIDIANLQTNNLINLGKLVQIM